ncbi:GPW/gp25 family protein [Teredinibacter franksiae]|jgi:Phage baseplate assembly protein W|uniref:GPW/gp25 family protein n=1 Tax=Teredinibacter franksiae TaxID=2761453 RepID=UPI0016266CBE|nr:GPW/gp25 family protein [Teredinibacter franksiae]
MALQDDIIGRGWSFPPEFDGTSHGIKMTTGHEDINNSLHIIFNTALGERVMQPKFGCSLHSMVFDSLNTGNLAYIRNMLETAILYHEPRIDAEPITFDTTSELGTLRIQIEYTVRGTNSRYNFVHPFYLNEGSGI